MGWEFAALLVGALALSTALSYWQNRVYLADINKLARTYAGQNLRLVSGQGKGRLTGAIAVLVINPTTHTVIEARTMTGATIFNRLQPAPHLHGNLDTLIDRAQGKHLHRAIENALALLPTGKQAAPALHPGQSTGRIRVRTPNRQASN